MNPFSPLPVLYHDKDLIVIQKASGLLVHRSLIDSRETWFALQILRDQIGQHVYPVHRLDKGTSGALVFALSPATAKTLSAAFAAGKVGKTYKALVRGWPHEQQVDHPLKEILDGKADRKARKDKPAQEARTFISPLQNFELPVAVDKYSSSRYCLVRARPETGRKHQIRRHLSHIRHPIIGDATHGVGVHNRYFDSAFGFRKLYLACTELEFPHPITGETTLVSAPLDEKFQQVLDALGEKSVGSLGSS